MSDMEIGNLEKKKIYIIEERKSYDDDIDQDEKIVYHQLNMFNAFNNIYNVLKQLQREGHNMDEVMKEFMSFYSISKSQGALRARRIYKPLYDMLNDIKDNLCEGKAKEQLGRDIHTISASLSGLAIAVLGGM